LYIAKANPSKELCMKNKLLYTAGYVAVIIIARVAEALAEKALDSTLSTGAKGTTTRQS
tara:strand:+ start:886 stop:1062 length:177 start_codon:yes stop_codon:yes gene_type:complete